jgi:hypothetical protein
MPVVISCLEQKTLIGLLQSLHFFNPYAERVSKHSLWKPMTIASPLFVLAYVYVYVRVTRHFASIIHILLLHAVLQHSFILGIENNSCKLIEMPFVHIAWLPKACRTAAVRKEVADAVIKVKYAKSNRHYTRTKGQIRTICH